MNQDILTLRYVLLDQAVLWDGNTKRHDIGTLILSFKKHGFKDPLKYEPKLNDDRGGIVEGNGRATALAVMFEENPNKPPRGIVIEEKNWLVPVLFGVDAESTAAAESYGYDHNLTNLSGGDNSMSVFLAQFEPAFTSELQKLMIAGETPVMFDEVDIQRLIDIQKEELTAINLDSGNNQSSGESGKRLHRCPKCGFDFED